VSDSVKLTTAELDAALSYLESGGASYMFPQPFEIAAIRESWVRVRPALERVDLLTYGPRECFQMTAPKQRTLVRPVHLLDPIDGILYTALVLRLAPAIQDKRDTYQSDSVFSYRFLSGQSGTKDTFKSDWDGKKARVRELCSEYAYVAATDIVDFFSRVYLHRLENAVAALSGDVLGTRCLMHFLEAWSDGTSYGIPTGPLASNFLAEALLVEVDQYLASCGITFVRWVDDYWMFANSEAEAFKAIFRLGERLNATQGLSLNASKTRMETTAAYLEWLDRDDPQAWRKQIKALLFADNDPYSQLDLDALTEEQMQAIDAVDARAVLERALSGDLVDLDSVRFIVTFLSALRRPDLIDLVLDNLGRLVPVSSSIANFFDSMDEVEEADHRGAGRMILEYIAGREFVPDFQAMWLLDPFTKSANWNSLDLLRSVARDARNRFVRRQAFLALRQSGDRSALLDAKSALADSRDWERRAILYACSRLPGDERDAVISQVGGHGREWTVDDALDKAVLVYMKAAGV
jgi:hypothetical protein